MINMDQIPSIMGSFWEHYGQHEQHKMFVCKLPNFFIKHEDLYSIRSTIDNQGPSNDHSQTSIKFTHGLTMAIQVRQCPHMASACTVPKLTRTNKTNFSCQHGQKVNKDPTFKRPDKERFQLKRFNRPEGVGRHPQNWKTC
jgi:hypothetical protein